MSLDWLLDSAQNKQLEPEASYGLNNPRTPAGSQKNSVPSKRTRADSDADINDSADVTKSETKIDNTTKSSATGKKRARRGAVVTKDSPAGDSTAEDNEPATKRFKDGQKAKSASLFVPVDEMCPLSRKLF